MLIYFFFQLFYFLNVSAFDMIDQVTRSVSLRTRKCTAFDQAVRYVCAAIIREILENWVHRPPSNHFALTSCSQAHCTFLAYCERTKKKTVLQYKIFFSAREAGIPFFLCTVTSCARVLSILAWNTCKNTNTYMSYLSQSLCSSLYCCRTTLDSSENLTQMHTCILFTVYCLRFIFQSHNRSVLFRILRNTVK